MRRYDLLLQGKTQKVHRKISTHLLRVLIKSDIIILERGNRAKNNSPAPQKYILYEGGIIMLLPSIFENNLFDDFFDFPVYRDFDNMNRKLYGKHGANLMKTDIRENEGGYEVDIDLPGFKKDEININLQNGYLIVGASKTQNNEDKDKQGKVLRQERYSGAMQRSFYVGDAITEEDIKARFEDGVLKLVVPKVEPKLPEKKTIMIEG